MYLQYISFLDKSVFVQSENLEAYQYLSNELEGYFLFSEVQPAQTEVLGTVLFFSDPTHYTEIEQKYNYQAHPSTDILLHGGSHSYDLRLGKVLEVNGRRAIHSLMTGSILVIDTLAHIVEIYNKDKREGAKDVRRVIRDQIYIPFWESKGAIVVHGAAYAEQGQGVLVMGQSGSGKTSFYLGALVNNRKFTYLTCERTLLVPEGDKIHLLGCPEAISIFPGTLLQFQQTSDIAHGVVLERSF
jgi:hypothetical protein